MFRRLRLVGRGQPSPGGRQMNRLGATNRTDGGSQPQVAMREGKALVAAVLAYPPNWTNSLPVADASGRAANARAIVPLPSASKSQPGGQNGERDAEKGGQEWRSSMAPR